MKLLVDNLKPDIILSHDDWGSKNTLFMSPETWREMIKPQYAKIYGYAVDHGVMVMHHADSFMEPIVEDMVADLGAGQGGLGAGAPAGVGDFLDQHLGSGIGQGGDRNGLAARS